ncbi:MAG: UvrD-helicase domain-containing protein, partial [Chloroflexota bacterium]|nr:UvrD-helicase domain-containing protein [Chloroflexota bacterium]
MVKTRHSALLDGLNPAQRDAVQHLDGPLLIVAGPGSGKTRVITHRIAYVVELTGISPSRLAAVTFTNRAAREMRNRLFGASAHDTAAPLFSRREDAQRLSVGTFHALCARILRADGEAVGIPSDFVILDADDQTDALKRAMEEADVDPKRFPLRGVLSVISSAKSQLVDADTFRRAADGFYEETVARVFGPYQAVLERSRAVDFDDLLRRTVELFDAAPDVLKKYQSRFQYLMVDEFQDTNVAQYRLAKQLAAAHNNLAVVGDPDQSIYSWRNADLRNILSFQADFPGAKTVHLSQNYRSTKTILAAAQRVISRNEQRLEQRLFTDNAEGEPIVVAEAYTEEEEAQMTIQEVERLTADAGYGLRDCVVTYRLNAQSRAIEEACLRYGVPYKIIGGMRFYQRREVKDVLAFLRLAHDPYDEISLARVLNVPPRGIGKRTADDLGKWAASLGVPPYTALQILAGEEGGTPPTPSPFAAAQQRRLADFLRLVNGLRADRERASLPGLVEMVIDRTGYRRMLIESGEPDADDRLDNIEELRAASAAFEGDGAEALAAFLENASLVSDQDAIQEDAQQYLTLITLHQVKGLEFPVVLMVGMEDGLLPHPRAFDAPAELGEDRGNANVGMTR